MKTDIIKVRLVMDFEVVDKPDGARYQAPTWAEYAEVIAAIQDSVKLDLQAGVKLKHTTLNIWAADSTITITNWRGL